MLHMEVYPALPTEAASIRKEVFMEEQGFVEEFDEIDHQARHIVVFNGEVPIGTCRFYWDQERNSYVLGRVAVRKAFRGQSLGLMLVQECEKQVIASKANKLFLAARVRVKEFYEKQGYTATGQEFLEEYCPHNGCIKPCPKEAMCCYGDLNAQRAQRIYQKSCRMVPCKMGCSPSGV